MFWKILKMRQQQNPPNVSSHLTADQHDEDLREAAAHPDLHQRLPDPAVHGRAGLHHPVRGHPPPWFLRAHHALPSLSPLHSYGELYLW